MYLAITIEYHLTSAAVSNQLAAYNELFSRTLFQIT